jgi:hypothetical protein
MSWEHWGDRLRIHIGDTTNPDDPRGREFGAHIELGVATGEFDSSLTAHPAQYGSWGFWVVYWHWGVSLMFRGPILGHYPLDEDD